ncbi:glycosyltransferase family 2 protein [candidate division WOR-3 bacterium]|nr:glycosyltransferase family 2 protein [candidate division WOR-3 bacterium]
MRNKIAFVIATKDRPNELQRMLKSLEAQSCQPDQIVIVDGGSKQVKQIIDQFTNLKTRYLRCIPPSGSRQRNIGIESVDPEITLIGFLDDDIELEANALEVMMKFWEKAPEKIGGAAFNMVNHPPLYACRLKHLSLVEKLGLYSKGRGLVPSSGFHTMIGYVHSNLFVQWLSSCAVVYRRNIFKEFHFDEWFEGYGYHEDMDFSYRVGKKFRLLVLSNAKYYHYPSRYGREDKYLFGKKEVINLLYFVRKHRELSVSACLLGLTIRFLLNIWFGIYKRETGFFKRALGNVAGLKHVLFV